MKVLFWLFWIIIAIAVIILVAAIILLGFIGWTEPMRKAGK